MLLNKHWVTYKNKNKNPGLKLLMPMPKKSACNNLKKWLRSKVSQSGKGFKAISVALVLQWTTVIAIIHSYLRRSFNSWFCFLERLNKTKKNFFLQDTVTYKRTSTINRWTQCSVSFADFHTICPNSTIKPLSVGLNDFTTSLLKSKRRNLQQTVITHLWQYTFF